MKRGAGFGGFAVGMACGLLLGVGGAGLVVAQTSGVRRTILTKAAAPGSTSYDVNMAAVEIAPVSNAGKHFHNGLEMTYVSEGSVIVDVQGKPAQIFNAGQAFYIDPAVPHDARNPGATPTKLIGVYVVDRNKPLAEPVK